MRLNSGKKVKRYIAIQGYLNNLGSLKFITQFVIIKTIRVTHKMNKKSYLSGFSHDVSDQNLAGRMTYCWTVDGVELQSRSLKKIFFEDRKDACTIFLHPPTPIFFYF